MHDLILGPCGSNGFVGEVLSVTFKLDVDKGISEGSFSFDIVITASEV